MVKRLSINAPANDNREIITEFPEDMPVTEAEIMLIETHFAELAGKVANDHDFVELSEDEQ